MEKMTMVKSLFAAAVTAAGLVAFAEPVVEITKAWQANPGSGTIDFTYEVRDLEGVGAWAYDVIVRVEAKDCENTFTFTNENVSVGSVTTNINYRAMLGDVYQNVSIYASLEKRPGGVQLWENGPYFAECNVGATKPEEYGYYFWWGDTVGYVRNAAGNGWVSAKDGTTTILFNAGASLSSSISLEALKSGGWVGDDRNLLAEHDAARVYLGGDWRIPTDAEIREIHSKCDCRLMSQNGVYGVRITGRDDYASKSIFMPAGGDGVGADRLQFPTAGYYWTATAGDSSTHSCDIGMGGGEVFYSLQNFRYVGFSVRPVRDAK